MAAAGLLETVLKRLPVPGSAACSGNDEQRQLNQ